MGGMKDLFGDEPYEAYARRTDPGTSHAAARDIGEVRINELETMAAKAIASHASGIINDQLVRITGIDWNTITPRVRPLINKGLVMTRIIDGRDETRPGSKGKGQTVWYATDKLRRYLRL
jgi:hypothetical protein